MLQSSDEAPVQVHDVVMLDLDGVVYAGGRAVDGAVEALAAVRSAGPRLAFITNNASRPPLAVAELLTSLRVGAEPADVVTSAQAAAGVLARRHRPGSRILHLGGEGLRQALLEVGLEPVADVSDPDVVAVVSGYGPDVLWRDVMGAAVRIRDGLPWIATNTDWTIPTTAGVAPGHGVMVRMLSDFAGVEPEVAGKPAPPLLEETIARTAARRPIMVGDRLDTDIAGARAVGIASLLVMTGVTDLDALVAAPADQRPDLVASDLSGLLLPHGAPQPLPRGADAGREAWSLGGWESHVADGKVRVEGSGGTDDWWRVVAAAAWAHRDETGQPVDTSGLRLPPAGAVGDAR